MDRTNLFLLITVLSIGLSFGDPQPDPDPAADPLKAPIPFPGVEPEHINCTGVHNLLDQYCHTHKCKNLFTTYCYNDVNGHSPGSRMLNLFPLEN